MTEPDLSADRWLPITSALPTPAPPAASDKRIQRMTARAAEKRTNRHDALQLRAEERRTLREERNAARTEARELRAQKRADRTESAHRAKDRATALGRGVLVTGPILAPMAVAWTGQSQFAIQILGWAFAASVLYAAAYELTTVYWAWLYHQARTDGDSGWEYRLGTWVFAAGAAVQQWWHYSDHWAATPRAVTYSVMSAVGVLLWEGRARLIHRRKMRAENKLAPARPRIGPARWIRYPVRSWTAWSLITLEGHRTLDAAWTAADRAVQFKKADRQKKARRPAQYETPVCETETSPVRPHGRREIETGLSETRGRALTARGTKTARSRDQREIESGASGETSLNAHVETDETETAEGNRDLAPRETETSDSVYETETTSPAPAVSSETDRRPVSDETQPPEISPPRTPRAETRKVSPIGDRDPETEIEHLLGLMRDRGSETAVSLDNAITETGRPRSTAAKRLKAARDLYRKTAA